MSKTVLFALAGDDQLGNTGRRTAAYTSELPYSATAFAECAAVTEVAPQVSDVLASPSIEQTDGQTR